MTNIVVCLSNARPVAGARRYEHLFPEKSPRWRFAQLLDPTTKPAGPAGDESALLLTATARGPRVVGVDYAGPLALWIVLTNPADGKEDEYNAWYDGRHIADTLALPGLTAAQRYTVKQTAGPEGARWSYLAIYEVELARVGEALAELAPGTAALPFRPFD
jgi:hypothetical protein